MTTMFRTKLRVKARKLNAMNQAELQAIQWQTICPRCGVDRNGCRPNPCPHGNWCGIKPDPSFAEARIPGPIFISRLFDPHFMTIQGGQSVWPDGIKTQSWN